MSSQPPEPESFNAGRLGVKHGKHNTQPHSPHMLRLPNHRVMPQLNSRKGFVYRKQPVLQQFVKAWCEINLPFNCCPDTKQQSSQWESLQSPRLRTAHHAHLSPQHSQGCAPWICQTVITTFYWTILRHLRKDMRCKWMELWHNGNWAFHLDNVPTHSVFTLESLSRIDTIVTLDPGVSVYIGVWAVTLLKRYSDIFGSYSQICDHYNYRSK